MQTTIVNLETGEVIERAMTATELKEFKASVKDAQEHQKAMEEARELRISAYKKLGLTDEEINAIL